MTKLVALKKAAVERGDDGEEGVRGLQGICAYGGYAAEEGGQA